MRGLQKLNSLDLNSLTSGDRPGLTTAAGTSLVEAASVVAQKAGKPFPREVQYKGEQSLTLEINGVTPDPQMARTYGDMHRAIEDGATAIALASVEHMFDLVVYERSARDGYGFDYHLVERERYHATQDDDNFFGLATHGLEVSGTIQDNTHELRSRVNEKRNRLKNKTQTKPIYIFVMDFYRARAHIELYYESA